MITDDFFSIFNYSSESWVHHCVMSCRKLGLNEQILEFANGGLENWLGVDVAKGVEDILRLCHQMMVCFAMRVGVVLTWILVA